VPNACRTPLNRLGRLGFLLGNGIERVEPRDDPDLGAVDERTVVLLDHPHGRPNDAGELKHRHAGVQRVRGEPSL
jgi:hypothetical protein